MSGPPFPPPPAPGSNAIGSFIIGVSPIGTIQPFEWRKTIISQYANSDTLVRLIENFNQYIDQTQNFDNFYDLIWNVDTAQGYGLDVWGRIVGVTRTLQVASENYFGFQEAGDLSASPFNQAPFYTGQTITNNYQLSDDAFRTLILAKALANISDCSIPAINQLLINLFVAPYPGRGNAYVTDGEAGIYFGFQEAGTANQRGFNQAPFYTGEPISHMTMTYTFEFIPTPVEVAIITQSGVLPKPTGVSASVVIV